MPRPRRHKSTIDLPWERRARWFGGITTPRQWRLGVLVVCVVAAIYGVWQKAADDARVRATRAAIGEARRAVLAFRTEIGRCPRSTVELVHPPRTGTTYLSEVPDDGWGRPLWIRCPAHDDPDDVDVISAGPSGSFFGDDNLP